ncbi:MAG: DeoR family transcriptional regulator [Paracoccaceae bacterium]|nr:DeoR family transcriptional regulator [Paracoccaceae bacterium]
MSKVTEKRRENSRKAREVYQFQTGSRAEQVVSYWDEKSGKATLSELSQRFGISERTARRYLNAAGRSLPPQKRRQIDMEKVREAHRLYSELGNKSAVARAMNCSRRQVGRYLQIAIDEKV